MNNTQGKSKMETNYSLAVDLAYSTAKTAHQTGHTVAEVLEANRDVFEAKFGKQATDQAFADVLDEGDPRSSEDKRADAHPEEADLAIELAGEAERNATER